MYFDIDTKVPIYCSECGFKIADDNNYDLLPIGTVFALKYDGFKVDRVFCGPNHFTEFYNNLIEKA